MTINLLGGLVILMDVIANREEERRRHRTSPWPGIRFDPDPRAVPRPHGCCAGRRAVSVLDEVPGFLPNFGQWVGNECPKLPQLAAELQSYGT